MGFNPYRMWLKEGVMCKFKDDEGNIGYVVREDFPEAPDGTYAECYTGLSFLIDRAGYSSSLPYAEDVFPQTFYGNTVSDIARRWKVSVADVLNRWFNLTDQDKAAFEFSSTGYSQGEWVEGVIVVDYPTVTEVWGKRPEPTDIEHYAQMWDAYLKGDVYTLLPKLDGQAEWENATFYSDEIGTELEDLVPGVEILDTYNNLLF